jgi:predicted acylesterase/phospholipase RssA
MYPKKKEEQKISHAIGAPHTSTAAPALTRQIENLVFEGGGVKGGAYAGTIEMLEKYQILPSVKRVAGASAGAIAAFLLGLGYDSKALAELMINIDLESFQDSSRWTIFGKGLDVYKDFGIYPGNKFEEWARERLKETTGNPDITFRGLREWHLKHNQRAIKNMYFIGTDLSTGYYDIFSPEHTPDMPIFLAVRISMALPLFFTPKRYGENHNLYADGGIVNNFPIHMFDLEGEENLSTLGFRVDNPEEIAILRDQQAPTRRKIDSLLSYILALYVAVTNVANNALRFQDEYFRTIYIDTKDVGTTEFGLTPERKAMLIEQGRIATEKFIKTYLLPSTQTGFHPPRLSDRQRLAKKDRCHMYEKAQSLFVRKIDHHTMVQLLFDPVLGWKIPVYFDRLKRQLSIREVSYGGLANKTADPILVFSGPASLYTEIEHWLEKHKAKDKCREAPIDSSEWICMDHYQRPSHWVQLRPLAPSSQGKALYDAVQKNNIVEVTCFLEKGVMPDYQDNYGQTALHIAVERHQRDIVALMLNQIPPHYYIDRPDHKGETPLHRLMANDDDPKKLEILNLLLQKGARLEACNKFGSTPLHRAAFWGRLDTVKVLVKAGANRDAVDKEGLTALKIAEQSKRGKYQEIIAYLEKEAEQEKAITQQWATPVKRGPMG